MTFSEVLSQAIAMLQQHGRVSYRALKREFAIDDAFLEDLKYELIEVQQCAVDHDSTVLVWKGDASTAATPISTPSPSATVPPPPTRPELEPLAYTPRHLAEKIHTFRAALAGERKHVTVLFEAYALSGRLERAHALAERALALAHQHQERGHQAYALRLLGEVAARREPPQVELAEDDYRQALVLADELGMRPLQAHCHRGLGTLYATAGQREPARTELATAIELYRTMDMTFWLPQAEAAQAQLNAP